MSKGQCISKEDFEFHFRNNYESLHRYAYTLVRDSDTAKDIVQQVFIMLWEKRCDIKIQVSLKAYLYKSIYNRSINILTRDVKHQILTYEDLSSHTTPSPSQALEAVELQNKINRVIELLPPQCRQVFYKIREGGKTYSEVATEMNLSIKTVEAHMSKALKMLRDSLSKAFFACIYLLSQQIF